MKILIVIPYCIENEFSECIASLRRQTFRQWEHLILRDLPHETADDTVYKTSMQHAKEFDLFIKLDADMVIEEPTVLARIVEAFEKRPGMDVLGVRLYDWFTGRLIPSLNIYRSSVRFPLTHDGLFTDPLPVSADRAVIGVDGLDGLVTHCKNPSPFQAFHFGMHRGLKVVHGDVTTRWGQVSLHMQNHQCVWRNFLKRKEERLGLAVLGGEMALARRFRLEDINYADPRARQVFAPYETWTAAQLRREIARLRYTNWGWLPWWIRLGIVNAAGGSAWPVIAKRAAAKTLRMLGMPLSKLAWCRRSGPVPQVPAAECRERNDY